MSRWVHSSNWHIQVFASNKRGSLISSPFIPPAPSCSKLSFTCPTSFYPFFSWTNWPHGPSGGCWLLTGMDLSAAVVSHQAHLSIVPIEGQELENPGRGEGEGTWRRNWWGNKWEGRVLPVLQPLKPFLRASEGREQPPGRGERGREGSARPSSPDTPHQGFHLPDPNQRQHKPWQEQGVHLKGVEMFPFLSDFLQNLPVG